MLSQNSMTNVIKKKTISDKMQPKWTPLSNLNSPEILHRCRTRNFAPFLFRTLHLHSSFTLLKVFSKSKKNRWNGVLNSLLHNNPKGVNVCYRRIQSGNQTTIYRSSFRSVFTRKLANTPPAVTVEMGALLRDLNDHPFSHSLGKIFFLFPFSTFLLFNFQETC